MDERLKTVFGTADLRLSVVVAIAVGKRERKLSYDYKRNVDMD